MPRPPGSYTCACIAGYQAKLASARLDLHVVAFIQVTMEREGSEKPVCIAESIGRRYA